MTPDTDSATDSDATDGKDSSQTLTDADLTGFQRDCLLVLGRAGAPISGQDLKAGLETLYGEEVNYGRLYPNLDDLAEAGYIEIGRKAIDDRTNSYELEAKGEAALNDRLSYLLDVAATVDLDESDTAIQNRGDA